MSEKDEALVKEYEENVGHAPRNLYPDDPDWTYSGSREERRALKGRVDPERPAVIEGQEELPL